MQFSVNFTFKQKSKLSFRIANSFPRMDRGLPPAKLESELESEQDLKGETTAETAQAL